MCSETPILVDKVIEKGIGEGIMPGAVLLVGSHDSIAYRKAYGYMEIKPEKLKIVLKIKNSK